MKIKKTAILLSFVALLFPTCQAKGNNTASAWDLLKELILIPGVSGEEEKVADYIQTALSGSFDVQRDDMDNIWFTVGEGSPHLLFLAHTDELGFLVQAVTPSGKELCESIQPFCVS